MKFKSRLDEEIIRDMMEMNVSKLKKFLTCVSIAGVIIISLITIPGISDADPFWQAILIGLVILSAILFTVMSIVRVKTYRKKIIKTAMEQLNTVHHTTSLIRDCELTEDGIKLASSDGEKNYLFTDIIKLVDRKTLNVVLKGNLILTIDKDTIEGGTLEELKEILANKIKVKK